MELVWTGSVMGNNGSKTPEAENNGEQESRESVSPPGAKRYPLRPQSLIGVDAEPCTGNHGDTTQLAYGPEVKGKTQPVSTGEQGRMSGEDPAFPVETKQVCVATKRTPGDVPGVTPQCDTATGGIIDNCRDKHGNSSYNMPHAARSFDASNDTCEKTTVSYQPVVSCTDIRMVDNKDLLLGMRCVAYSGCDATKEEMDRKVCTVRQPETRTRQSPDGESMNLDLNPNEENAMFVRKEKVSLSVLAEGSSDHLDSGGQKDDRDDSGTETDQPQPVDVADSPLQYEDCVEYIESGHTSDSLPDVIDLAADRPETEGREVLLDRSIEKEGDNSMEEVNSPKSKDKSSAVSIHE